MENQALQEAETWREQQVHLQEQQAAQNRAKQELEAEVERHKQVGRSPQSLLMLAIKENAVWVVMFRVTAGYGVQELQYLEDEHHRAKITLQSRIKDREDEIQKLRNQVSHSIVPESVSLGIKTEALKNMVLETHQYILFFSTLPADQQDTEQQQPDGAGESTPPADGNADPEADHAGGSGHGKKLPGLPAGAFGAAAEERSGRAKRRPSYQYECPGRSRLGKAFCSCFSNYIFKFVFGHCNKKRYFCVFIFNTLTISDASKEHTGPLQ